MTTTWLYEPHFRPSFKQLITTLYELLEQSTQSQYICVVSDQTGQINNEENIGTNIQYV